MKNKVVLITGGSKGYGAGIAEVLKKAGAHVWITGRDRNALEKTAVTV
jgi:NADP-dependent 3-hydroxy acid dehydrogenase YdfG